MPPGHSQVADMGSLVNSQPPVRRTATASEAVIVVDPFSTGSLVAAEVIKRGHRCIQVVTTFGRTLMGHSPIHSNFVATIMPMEEQDCAHTHYNVEDEVDHIMSSLKELPFTIMQVLVGTETGVEVTDALAERLGLRCNISAGSLMRRSKFVMHQTIAARGLRAARQKLVTSWEEAEAYLLAWNGPLEVVLKPTDSAGTDGVHKATSMEAAKTAYHAIANMTNVLGHLNTSVLIQEFLRGPEYTIDTVSRDGVHKVVALWEFKKGRVGSADFVYLSGQLLPVTGDRHRSLVDYVYKVLDALNISQGPGHMEVKWCPVTPEAECALDGEPCLIEVGARCHGADGSWCGLVNKCVGYSQIQAQVDCFLDPEAFHALPKECTTLLKPFNREVDLVCYDGGVFKGYGPAPDIVRQLPSFFKTEDAFHAGDIVRPTDDCLSIAGYVHLVGDSEEQVEADVATIRELERTGQFFIVEPAE